MEVCNEVQRRGDGLEHICDIKLVRCNDKLREREMPEGPPDFRFGGVGGRSLREAVGGEVGLQRNLESMASDMLSWKCLGVVKCKHLEGSFCVSASQGAACMVNIKLGILISPPSSYKPLTPLRPLPFGYPMLSLSCSSSLLTTLLHAGKASDPGSPSFFYPTRL